MVEAMQSQIHMSEGTTYRRAFICLGSEAISKGIMGLKRKMISQEYYWSGVTVLIIDQYK